jgi:hypothetical protein
MRCWKLLQVKPFIFALTFLLEDYALNALRFLLCCLRHLTTPFSFSLPLSLSPVYSRDVMTATTLNNLGVLLKGEQKLQEAQASYTEALETRR